MQNIRLIIQSSSDGEKEFVHFTDELDVPSEDFLMPDCTIDFDKVITANLPSGFPLGYDLKRLS